MTAAHTVVRWTAAAVATFGLGASTGAEELLVLDRGTGSILAVSTVDGSATVLLAEEEITAVTGHQVAALKHQGLTEDGAGNLYFADNLSSSVLRLSPGGEVSVFASAQDLQTAAGRDRVEPEGLAYGDDGFLYLIESRSESVLRVNPVTGTVTVHAAREAFEALPDIDSVDLESGIVAAPGGLLYLSSEGSPNAILAVDAEGAPSVVATGEPLTDLELFMTREPGGDLLVTDAADLASLRLPRGAIRRVTLAGTISTHLDNADLDPVAGTIVSLEGGLAVDGAGNLLIADTATDAILAFDSSGTGAVLATADDLRQATGQDPDLSAGIAITPATFPPPAMYLNQDRFLVEVEWQDFQGNTGHAAPVKLTNDSGYHWFFGPDNIEVVVKVLDACAQFDRYWVFAAGLTNVGVTLKVTDMATLEQRTYTNQLGDTFVTITDSDAFATCGASRTFHSPPPPARPDPAKQTRLLLNDDRFAVGVEWEDFVGNTGDGAPVELTGDSGYFWFFGPDNIEVVVKVLDACGVNERYWVFAAGLTNAGVTMTVTDLLTGQEEIYTNVVGETFETVLDTGSFATCGSKSPKGDPR